MKYFMIHKSFVSVYFMSIVFQVKNYLTSKDSSVKQQHQNQWVSLDDTARGAIKNLVSNFQILFLT